MPAPPTEEPPVVTALVAAVVLALSLLVTQALLLDRALLAYPFGLDYGEGPLLDQANRLRSGLDLFTGFEARWAVTNYPPVYVSLVALFGGGLRVARTISLVAGFVAAGAVGFLASRGRPGWTAPIAAGLLLTAPWLTYWMPLARVDLTALALAWLGLCALALPRRHATPLGTVLLVLACGTRQSFLLLAVLALASVYKRPRDGERRELALGIGLGGLVVGTLLLVAGGSHLWEHLVLANLDAWSWPRCAVYLRELYRVAPILVLLGALGLRLRDRADRLVLAAVGAGLVDVLLAGKVGSNANYLLPLLAALSAATARGIGSAPTLARLVLLVLVGGQLWLWQGPAPLGDRYHPWLQQRMATRSEQAALSDRVATLPDPLLADEDTALLAIRGRPVVWQAFEMTQLAERGLFDEGPLVAALQAGRFPAVLLFDSGDLVAERWPPAAREALHEHYRPIARHGATTVFVPRVTH